MRGFARTDVRVFGRVVAIFALCVIAVSLYSVFVSSEARAEDLIVTRSDDSSGTCSVSSCSLREAITEANGTASDDKITFAQNVQTVALDGSELPNIASTSTAGTLTIDGGSDVAVSANGRSRVFNLNRGANLTLDSITVAGGNTDFGSGANVIQGSTLTVTDSTFSNNRASSQGAGILNNGTLKVSDSTFSGNRGGQGGGIANAGPLTVSGTTFSGSSASDGGGIFSTTDNSEAVTVTNSTFSDNTVTGFGGGIYNNSGVIRIENSTITNNSAPAGQGSGVSNFGASGDITEVYSSIIAGNTNSDVDNRALNAFRSGDNNTGGYNVVGSGNASNTFNNERDQRNVSNPGLGTLANNGGPTQTHALLLTSPALNAGDPGFGSPPAFDQRGSGFDRVTGGRIDVGSFEVQQQSGPEYVVTRDDDRDQTCLVNDCSLREAIKAANATSSDNEITFADNVQTVTLAGTQLTIDSTSTAGTLTIDGGSDVAVSANGRSRVFDVNEGADLTLDSISVTGGDAGSGNGGGVDNRGALTVEDSTFSENSASGNGGGIGNGGTLTVTDSTFSDNSAGNGGGISNGGKATVSGSTFSENTASGNGGGIFSETSPALTGNSPELKTTISNSTFSGNSASASGGGIYNIEGLTRILSTTVTDNAAPNGRGGGVASFGDNQTRTEVYSSIVAANRNSDVDFVTDFGGTSINSFQSDGYNVVGSGNATGDFGSTAGDHINVTTDEAFGTFTPTLEDNDGPTHTVELFLGSLAINNVPASESADQPETDQRGIERPKFTRFDSGAYEYDGLPPAITISPEILPAATEDESYSIQLTASGDDGTAPYTYTVSSGSLPQGLTLSQNGRISGTPTEAATTRSFVVTATDASGFTGERPYTITVNEVNDRPTISPVGNKTIKVNGATGAIRFTVKDSDDPASRLSVSGRSSNTNLVKPAGIKITGTGQNRTVKVTPVKNKIGRTTITLLVSDPSGLIARETFTLTVRR